MGVSSEKVTPTQHDRDVLVRMLAVGTRLDALIDGRSETQLADDKASACGHRFINFADEDPRERLVDWTRSAFCGRAAFSSPNAKSLSPNGKIPNRGRATVAVASSNGHFPNGCGE